MGQTDDAMTVTPSVCVPANDSEQLFRALARLECSLAEAERGLMTATLDLTQGNRSAAARRLQISVRTVYNKIRRFARSGCRDQCDWPGSGEGSAVQRW